MTEPAPAGFREELDAAIGSMPERYRQPLVLFHMEGNSLDATARRLGLKPGTVGSQLARAREMLRAKLMRRGVGVVSVGALTTLLSAEAGAAVLPAADVTATRHIGNRDSDHTMLRRRLESIAIPGWRITEEPLTKAVAKLADAIKANDPEQAGVTIELDPPTPSLRLQMVTLLTMESRGVPTTAMQILRGMAEMSQQRIAFENNRVVLSPLHPERTTVVIAEVKFRDAPVSEVVRSLQSRTGVPIRLQRTGNLPLVTLSAKGIQLDNAVLSIAGQTGSAMGYEQDGLVLKQRPCRFARQGQTVCEGSGWFYRSGGQH